MIFNDFHAIPPPLLYGSGSKSFQGSQAEMATPLQLN
jgi:hypothetical protein